MGDINIHEEYWVLVNLKSRERGKEILKIQPEPPENPNKKKICEKLRGSKISWPKPYVACSPSWTKRPFKVP